MSKEQLFPDIRMGIGYDVHKLTEGRALILGGVSIPFDASKSSTCFTDMLHSKR